MRNLTETIRHRYDRIAPFFSRMDAMAKESWRKDLFSHVRGEILEVGVGTGANLAYYPAGLHVTGIDFSPRMLSYARQKVSDCPADITLMEMDIQALAFPDNTFDTVVSTCVFCSVPNPVEGLKEIRRVLKPDGQLLMIEHMLSEHGALALLLHALNPLTVRLTGANVNRRTIENLDLAGFPTREIKNVAFFDVFRSIRAIPK